MSESRKRCYAEAHVRGMTHAIMFRNLNNTGLKKTHKKNTRKYIFPLI